MSVGLVAIINVLLYAPHDFGLKHKASTSLPRQFAMAGLLKECNSNNSVFTKNIVLIDSGSSGMRGGWNVGL
jgi:hypothetical protein